jgi:hypothetical protein
VTLDALTAGILLVMSLAVPGVRANRRLSGASLDEVLQPPPRPIALFLLYSNEKEARLEAVLQQMKAVGVCLDGRPLEVTLDKSGSRMMILAVPNGSVEPDRIGPAGSLQLAILEGRSTSRHVVDPSREGSRHQGAARFPCGGACPEARPGRPRLWVGHCRGCP